MSLKQRTPPLPTSNFLQKFKGKTSMIGKDGLTGLFSGSNLKIQSSVSLHNSVHLDKQNRLSRQNSIKNQRINTLSEYTIQPANLQKRMLVLPKLTNNNQSQQWHQNQQRKQRKIYSEYNKIRKGCLKTKKQRLHLDDEFRPESYNKVRCQKYEWQNAIARQTKVYFM